MEKIYEDNLYPSLDEFYKILKKEGLSFTKKQVKDFLDKREEQQLTKETKTRKEDMGHIVAYFENQIWQLDIYILQKYVKSNNGYRDILACVDVFTRKAYCVPMKSKDIDDVTTAFTKILKQGKPQMLISDSDSSFLGAKFQSLLSKNDIIHDVVPVGDHMSLGIIDRFARTIKTKFTKIFLAKKKTNWVDYLDSIISNYNNKPHSSLGGIAPNEVNDNLPIIMDINKIKSLKNNVVSDLNIGDNVRILDKTLFTKGTEPKYSEEIYTVKAVQGKKVTLNNGVVKKRNMLLAVPPETKKSKNIVKEVNKENRIDRRLKVAGIEVNNEVRATRTRNKPSNLKDYVL